MQHFSRIAKSKEDRKKFSLFHSGSKQPGSTIFQQEPPPPPFIGKQRKVRTEKRSRFSTLPDMVVVPSDRQDAWVVFEEMLYEQDCRFSSGV